MLFYFVELVLSTLSRISLGLKFITKPRLLPRSWLGYKIFRVNDELVHLVCLSLLRCAQRPSVDLTALQENIVLSIFLYFHLRNI